MSIKISFLILCFCLLLSCQQDDDSATIVEDGYELNENGSHQDFLTPAYYTLSETALRDKINTFIHFSRIQKYQHPFENPNGEVAEYTTKREFGDGIGLGGTAQHHPAIDMYLNNSVDTNIYAIHDGIVNTYRDDPKYRNYLSITKEITDSENTTIGKIVTIYAHIDLDLDENSSIQLNGVVIKKGDLVSKNLYSSTMGGAHLHLEIRFYKTSEFGNEEFYSWENNNTFTNLSSGIWNYGYWNTKKGLGFGNPINFGI